MPATELLCELWCEFCWTALSAWCVISKLNFENCGFWSIWWTKRLCNRWRCNDSWSIQTRNHSLDLVGRTQDKSPSIVGLKVLITNYWGNSSSFIPVTWLDDHPLWQISVHRPFVLFDAYHSTSTAPRLHNSLAQVLDSGWIARSLINGCMYLQNICLPWVLGLQGLDTWFRCCHYDICTFRPRTILSPGFF